MSKYGTIPYKKGWVPMPEHIISHKGLLPGPLASLSPAALRMFVYVAGISRGADIEITNDDLLKFAA